MLLAKANLLQSVLEFTGAEKLALKFALVNLVSVASDHVEDGIDVWELGDVADVDEAALD